MGQRGREREKNIPSSKTYISHKYYLVVGIMAKQIPASVVRGLCRVNVRGLVPLTLTAVAPTVLQLRGGDFSPRFKMTGFCGKHNAYVETLSSRTCAPHKHRSTRQGHWHRHITFFYTIAQEHSLCHHSVHACCQYTLLHSDCVSLNSTTQ